MPDLTSSLRSVAAAAAMTLVAACGDKDEAAPTTPPATAPLPAPGAAKAVTTEDAAPPSPEPTELVIELTPRGSGGVAMSLGGRVLGGDDELGHEARRALAASPDAAAVIKPTRETPHGEVVRVMEILKAAGIRRLSVVTAEAEPGAATPASGGR